jgi:hypothetical protein
MERMAKAGDFPGVMEINADFIEDALELVGNINGWFERTTPGSAEPPPS